MGPMAEAKRIISSVEFWVILTLWSVGFLIYGTSFPFDYDSINYALAIVDSFNPSLHQPQPPGYFFHVLFGQLLYPIIKNPFRILQIQGIIYMTLLLTALFLVPAGRGIRLFLCLFPLPLFFAGAPVIYSALAGFSAIICYQVIAVIKQRRSPVVLATIFGIAIGFRQDLSLFLLPAVLYALRKYRPSFRQLSLMGVFFSICCALWFVPTVLASNRSPVDASAEIFHTFAKDSSFFMGTSISEALRCAIRFVLYGLGVFGPAGTVYLATCWKRAAPDARILLLVGISPSILFGLLIHGPKPGYYGTAFGFFLVWSLWAVRPVLQMRWWIALTFCNLLFFAIVPPMKQRSSSSLTGKLSRQFSAVGACGATELLRTRNEMDRLDKTFGGCPCIDTSGITIDRRFFDYLPRYRWHAAIATVSDSNCCSFRKSID